MRKLTYLLLFGLGLVAACGPNEDGNLEEIRKEVTVNIGLTGKYIDLDNQPINGRISSDSEQTYYFIEVRQWLPTQAIYARAILDHLPESLPLTLLANRTFRVYAYALRKGETAGLVRPSDSTVRVNNQDLVIRNEFELNNSFFLSAFNYYTSADSSTSSFIGSSNYGPFDYGPLDVFFGTRDIDTSQPFDSVYTIDLKRQIFGYDISVSDVTTGFIQVNLLGRRFEFLPGLDSTESEVLHRTSSDWFGGDVFNEGLSVRHFDTISGVAVQSILFSQNVDFTRLQRKQIHITAPADTLAGESPGSGFSITLDDQPLVLGDTLEIGG